MNLFYLTSALNNPNPAFRSWRLRCTILGHGELLKLHTQAALSICPFAVAPQSSSAASGYGDHSLSLSLHGFRMGCFFSETLRHPLAHCQYCNMAQWVLRRTPHDRASLILVFCTVVKLLGKTTFTSTTKSPLSVGFFESGIPW